MGPTSISIHVLWALGLPEILTVAHVTSFSDNRTPAKVRRGLASGAFWSLARYHVGP